jgi:hypothetical protein
MRGAFPNVLAVVLLLAAQVRGAEPDRRIVSAASVALRDAPGVSRGIVARLSLGTLVVEVARTGGVDTIAGETAPWLEVATPSGREGWLFGALTRPYAEAERDALALEIAGDRLERSGDPFEAFAELHAFLGRAAGEAATPDARARLELATLRALDRTAGTIGFRRKHDPAALAWVEANARDLVWNEPAARWIVVADRLWELYERSAALPAADEIAWEAARAQLPGECEGDVPCALAGLARTDLRYLERHPRGAHADVALGNVATALDAAVEDPRGAGLFAGSPAEDLDRTRSDLEKATALLARIDDPRARAARSAAEALLARAAAPGEERR